MLSQQEISDRFEIQDLLYHYADLIDKQQIDELRNSVFTADAQVDYSAVGGSVGDLDITLEFLKASLTRELFPNSQHLNANLQIRVDGDTSQGRVMCFNPMEMRLSESETQTYFIGVWYVDEYRRTEAGWRICSRREEKSWVFNAPDFMNL